MIIPQNSGEEYFGVIISMFNGIEPDGKHYFCRPLNKNLDPRYTTKTLKYGGGNFMIWDPFLGMV